ncbi:MAG: hypothetical protein GF335_03005 [Candidatus Moranbacteria bacterium]|nr:hypothetical protein [Candidatus Moranbacteria bacterium]
MPKEQNSFSQKIISQIKKENIKPHSKWKFTAINYLVWFAVVFMVLFGAFAFTLIITALWDIDWYFYKHPAVSRIKFFLIIIPYLWVVAFILFSFLGYYIFRKTQKGYRYNFFIVCLAVIFSSIFFGVVFYKMGLGATLEQRLASKMPIIKKIHPNREQRWMNPQIGLLAGRIELVSKDHLILIDFNSKEWKVLYPDKVYINKHPRMKVFITHFREGLLIRVIGEKVDDSVFQAKIFRPWSKPQRESQPNSRSRN